MKYLILLFLTFNVFAATQKIEVKHYKTGVKSHGAKKEQSKATAWINKIESRRTPWGYKKQRFVHDIPSKPISPEDLADFHQSFEALEDKVICRDANRVKRECSKVEVIDQEFVAAEGENPEIPEVKHWRYEIPAQYVIKTTDITEEVNTANIEEVEHMVNISAIRDLLKLSNKDPLTQPQVKKLFRVIVRQIFGKE